MSNENWTELHMFTGVPRCLRMDAGTENTLTEDIQKAFRYDHNDDMAGSRSVIKGSSHSNQVCGFCFCVRV